MGSVIRAFQLPDGKQAELYHHPTHLPPIIYERAANTPMLATLAAPAAPAAGGTTAMPAANPAVAGLPSPAAAAAHSFSSSQPTQARTPGAPPPAAAAHYGQAAVLKPYSPASPATKVRPALPQPAPPGPGPSQPMTPQELAAFCHIPEGLRQQLMQLPGSPAAMLMVATAALKGSNKGRLQQARQAAQQQTGSWPGSPVTPAGLTPGSGQTGLPPGAVLDRQLSGAGRG
ncbi:hypothetical protein COO60DRAFT_1639394 [Scenedesmus sp. NREL 46B-D3]|nr:hypothetical protein COO60DRAFT_1639394 [Scenedesmus sp. NREL 46B-D3]